MQSGIFSQLIIGTLASLIAALIVFFTAIWRSKTVRRALTAVASTFLDVQIKYVFPTGKDAEPTITQELAESSRVKIFAGRGLQFQEHLYAPLLREVGTTIRKVQILLPNADGTPRGLDWIKQRENELSKIDRSFGHGILREQIRTSIQFLLRHMKDDSFQIRLYDTNHIGRIVVTDQSVFFTPYSAVKHGRDCKVYHYGRGDIYDNFVRFFDSVWEDSVEPQPPIASTHA